jgi:Flp pilus assembly protein TadD
MKRFKSAEMMLKKAVELDTKDAFSYQTLGIVYYQQEKFDESMEALTRALDLNPRNAIAHNYLGITASRKGWPEAAEKEILEAIALNPDYADAHFNLAVVYAMNEPPSAELARRHYKKAVELGAPPDEILEKMLKE